MISTNLVSGNDKALKYYTDMENKIRLENANTCIQDNNLYSIFSSFRSLCDIEKAENFRNYILCLKVAIDTRAQGDTLLSFLFNKLLEFTRKPKLFLDHQELFAVDNLHQRLYVRIEAKYGSLYQYNDISRMNFEYALNYLQCK